MKNSNTIPQIVNSHRVIAAVLDPTEPGCCYALCELEQSVVTADVSGVMATNTLAIFECLFLTGQWWPKDQGQYYYRSDLACALLGLADYVSTFANNEAKRVADEITGASTVL